MRSVVVTIFVGGLLVAGIVGGWAAMNYFSPGTVGTPAHAGAVSNGHPEDCTNVNFAALIDRATLRMRTFEKGVEDETLSCGTGATASAILTHLWGLADPPITVRTTGGIPLIVDFTRPADPETLPDDPRLTGDARVIFRGALEEV